jgi:hypothetical protein
MSLIFLAPAIARADTFAINVTFQGGVTGTGSFNTDGTCPVCDAGSTLTNFTFTVGDDTFNEAAAEAGGLAFGRSINFLASGPITGVDSGLDSLKFAGSVITFEDADDGGFQELLGTGTISAVPEPTSLLLLAGVIACLTWGLRKRSAIH